MHLEGVTIIKAPRQKVWEFLTDAHQVSQCAPGVESVEIIVPGRKFRAVAAIGFGTVKARFAGDAEFVELDAPHRAKIKAHGNAPGSAARYSRREVMRKMGMGAAVLVPMVTSIVAQAATSTASCVASNDCAGRPVCTPCGPPQCVKKCDSNGNCSNAVSGC